jgi:hypothetical protein
MAVPPVELGAVHERATVPFPAVGEDRVGAPGTATGVADISLEATERPTVLTVSTS